MYREKEETIIGTIEVVGNDGKITHIEFVHEKEKKNSFKDEREGMSIEEGDVCIVKECLEELREYFKGQRKEFHVDLFMEGTEFQKKVWEELLKIPYGTKVTYGEIAKRIGNPKAFRAVGHACNKNPIPIIVPCHRIIGRNSKLVGYAGGLEIKQKLLKLEDL